MSNGAPSCRYRVFRMGPLLLSEEEAGLLVCRETETEPKPFVLLSTTTVWHICEEESGFLLLDRFAGKHTFQIPPSVARDWVPNFSVAKQSVGLLRLTLQTGERIHLLLFVPSDLPVSLSSDAPFFAEGEMAIFLYCGSEADLPTAAAGALRLWKKRSGAETRSHPPLSVFLPETGFPIENGKGQAVTCFSAAVAYGAGNTAQRENLRTCLFQAHRTDRVQQGLLAVFFSLWDTLLGKTPSCEEKAAVLSAVEPLLFEDTLPFLGDEPWFAPVAEKDGDRPLGPQNREEGSALSTAALLYLLFLWEEKPLYSVVSKAFLPRFGIDSTGGIAINAPLRRVTAGRERTPIVRYGFCPSCTGYPRRDWLYPFAGSFGCLSCLAEGNREKDATHRPKFLPGASFLAAEFAAASGAVPADRSYRIAKEALSAAVSDSGALAEHLPLYELCLLSAALHVRSRRGAALPGLVNCAAFDYALYVRCQREVPTLLTHAVLSPAIRAVSPIPQCLDRGL